MRGRKSAIEPVGGDDLAAASPLGSGNTLGVRQVALTRAQPQLLQQACDALAADRPAHRAQFLFKPNSTVTSFVPGEDILDQMAQLLIPLDA